MTKSINLELAKGIITKYLGSSQSLTGGEEAYHCPFCNHHKPKLQVNFSSQKWHCWVCNSGGRSVLSLAKKLDISKKELEEIGGIYFEEAKKKFRKDGLITNETFGDTLKALWEGIEEEVDKETHINFRLPEGWKSALDLSYNVEHPIEGQAIKYLKERGIDKKTIIKYNIGFCVEGPYMGRVIIPSYDSNGMINYYVGRSVFDDSTMKYKNPPVSKDVVCLDSQIDWNEPIILCEGMFDAIAIKRQAIPLLGKFIPHKLMDKILEKSTEIYIALDNDAKQDAVKLVEKLEKYGKSVKIIELDDKDPSEIGYQNFWKYQKNSVTLSWDKKLKEKLNSIL